MRSSPRPNDRPPCTAALVLDTLGRLFDGPRVVGISAGIAEPKGSLAFGLGFTNEQKTHVPGGATIYEIGSVTKVFTGILLAEMVERGEVKLDDPVQDLLPAEAKVPSRNGKVITLLLLATHSSGLPRLPANLHPKNPSDPYADYTEDNLYEFLSKCELKRDPGERADYSNLGAGLLGLALTRRAGAKSYEELAIERICAPLEMDETRATLSESMKERLAQPFAAPGRTSSNWSIPTLAGAGAMRSSVDDMLRFVRFCLDPDDSTLGRAVRTSFKPQRPFDGRPDQIGLAWLLRNDGSIFHNGQTGGYHAYVGLRPDRGVGLVVLTNTSTDAIDAPCDALLKKLTSSGDARTNDAPPRV